MKFPKSIRKKSRILSIKFRDWIESLRCAHLVLQIKRALDNIDGIPTIIISYNNGTYVRNITTQLNSYNITPIIIDNNSSSDVTQEILYSLEKNGLAYIARSRKNHGHMVGFLKPIYNLLPEIFCYTDPDISLNKNLPDDFLSKLSDLTVEFQVFKAGFALSLQGNGPLKDLKFHSCHYRPIYYEADLSIREFEARYWMLRLAHVDLDVYAAPIDTTFALYRKSNYIGNFYTGVRVAGDYSAVHLPWFKEADTLSEVERSNYKKTSVSSNWIE
jgi:hypothetical protein